MAYVIEFIDGTARLHHGTAYVLQKVCQYYHTMYVGPMDWQVQTHDKYGIVWQDRMPSA